MSDNPRASEIIEKTVVSEEHGKKYGTIDDISFVSDTGELMNLLITDTTQHLDENKLQEDRRGRSIIPFSAVRSVGDFVIVTEDDIM
ncbi:hypothetical protein AQV86_00985 [Nanohaloarchaea archaeon SG9]|nr:hypothetical protein AQV86_00985 [Nanohaloarchaea archaeon SG9]